VTEKKITRIFDTLNELISRVLSKEAIPQEFSSTMFIFQSGVGGNVVKLSNIKKNI